MFRTITVVLCLVAAGCSSTTPDETPTAFCAEVGGTWDNDACKLTGTNAKHITVDVSAEYPTDLVDEPALQDFLRKFFATYGHPDDQVAQNGHASLTYKTYTHGGHVKSIVFSNDWYLGGAHPNDEIVTYSFDDKKAITLTDLLCPGNDALTALPPIVRPFIRQAIGEDGDISRYEPGGDYAENYKAWYLDGDDLVLVMPASRFGPVHSGMWQPRIPLSALRPILRETGC
ncbi:hypothetical protein [Antrihabitans stalactiti]|uniref:DUF3298 domain-containing protein n=1 Tax=Antrihabitans stalactiti TaxID=2584121 RepID=A0A848KFY4_9NOCA|nr:hypothetical protein [Antrihabitans stalactiti]NMN97209.1 hypothetical protein [Antrihabitans stalactiti]